MELNVDGFSVMPSVLRLVQEMEKAEVHLNEIRKISSSVLGTLIGSADTIDVDGHIIASAVFENTGRRHPSTSIL